MKGFSVIMPTYNQCAFIRRAILSLFQQTYPDWELIIINDGCSDDTEKYIDEYLSNERVHYIKSNRNQGLGFSINQGLDIAQYDYIAYLPSDDFYYNNHLEVFMENFKKSENTDMVISGVKFDYSDSYFQNNSHLSRKLIKGYCPQLVQTAHRKTGERWIERAEFESNDLFSLFWYKLIDRDIAFTDQVTANWTNHPHQRYKIIAENKNGGLNYFRHYYQVHTQIKLQCEDTVPVDEEKLYASFKKPGKTTKDRLKILIAGELAYHSERIIALEEQGHILYGLWVEGKVLSFDTLGPLPFGNVMDISYENRIEEIKKIQPDVIYALLNERAVPLAHELLMSGLDIPFIWHFKEGPFVSMQNGSWKKLIDLYTYSDGQIYINRESKDWFEQFICSENQMAFILDGDLPKVDFFTNDFSPLLSDSDGEIHTVAPGRVVGISSEDLQELARQKINLHLYVFNYPNTREQFISMAKKAMGKRFHLHKPCLPQDWVKEFSKYDAGWLHCFKSRNQGKLMNVEWNDLNLPARMTTLIAAGLPMLMFNNKEHIVAVQSKIEAFDVGICFDDYGQLEHLLRDKNRMQALRKNVFEHRKQFSFDYHVPDLIDFFRKVIDKKKKKI